MIHFERFKVVCLPCKALYKCSAFYQGYSLASFTRVRVPPTFLHEDYHNLRFYHICAEFGRQDLSNITEIVALNASLNYQLTMKITKLNFPLEFHPIVHSVSGCTRGVQSFC